ncbi:MAG: hypothetical protein RI554_05465 [Trueperaceae bacterium]|nr:hypothetical protein [Trueperaceae bacterium]
MTLSRTSRILLGLLLLAVAAFVWVNLAGGGLGPPAPTTADVAPNDSAANAPETSDGETNDGSPASRGADADPAPPAAAPREAADGPSDVDVVALPSQDGGDAPSPRIVARDVELATFPATPTPSDAEADAAAGDADTEEGVLGDVPDPALSASDAVARATRLNPFASVAAGVGDAASGASPTDDPTDPDPDVARALPAPTVPATPDAATPRRALPGRMLASSPTLLQRPRTDPGPAARSGSDGGASAAVPSPGLPSATVPTDAAGTPTLPQGAAATSPDLLGTSGGGGLATTTDGTLAPTLDAAGVRFTGSVVGSVGVGVFRMAGDPAPVVLALGQSLPGSDIVLADVGGRTATFALGDATHVLTLDPRR